MDIERTLETHGVQPYINRVMIYEHIINHDHPTVDDIFHAVREKNKRLSKMTVYNVIELLLKAGLIREVTIDDKKAAYDIRTGDHGHFKCRTCGEIMDFDVDMDNIKTGLPEDIFIEKKDLFFYGLCEKCKSNEDA